MSSSIRVLGLTLHLHSGGRYHCRLDGPHDVIELEVRQAGEMWGGTAILTGHGLDVVLGPPHSMSHSAHSAGMNLGYRIEGELEQAGLVDKSATSSEVTAAVLRIAGAEASHAA